ncbi:unnamed protein product [Rotaria socialis]|uniref:Proteasome activator Blm10 middle HEAT repeats region domain-containing protein n=1 Tax=Rotaria socialis TaxID=392032 RepID=A0A820VQM1_9BILA|nr:unnamed protein product [Rotaria socialis]
MGTDDHEINNTCDRNTDEMTHDNNLQKPCIYNKYLPFYDSIKRQGVNKFDEIRENLSRTIQLNELQPGFSFWSNALKEFITLYGFYFTKDNHLKLVNFYLSVLSITDLQYTSVKICCELLSTLLRKTRLITRDDLVIDWHTLYRWAKLVHNNHDKAHALVTLPEGLEFSILWCTHYCSPYFSKTATQEILEIFRPQFYPNDSNFFNIILWLSEFFDIWESIYNRTVWELHMIGIFSSAAWNNIGYIDWEPWLAQIFTRILRGFSLPVGKMQTSPQRYRYITRKIARWIVAMMGNGSACLTYLDDLLMAMKNFYHPSNTGKFQKNLVEFLLDLSDNFVDRVRLERKAHPVWWFQPHESCRLTEQNITDFVNCIKDYVFTSIFNKEHGQKAIEACQYLSMLRPELIVSPMAETLFSSIENITEPHRFTTSVVCLTHLARQLVRQTSSYSAGQVYVLPLLMSVLPGIDLNDPKKISTTLKFLNTVLSLITCVDCSSAVHIRNDLTEIEKQVCLSTKLFENFISTFLDRVFQMIEHLSSDMFDATMITDEVNIDYRDIELLLESILRNITGQCSSTIYRFVQEKLTNFLSGAYFSPKVKGFVSAVVRALLHGNPVEALKCVLPKTCESIEKIMNHADTTELFINGKEDLELIWYLTLFSELVRARGDTLLIYKPMIMSIFHRSTHIVHKYSYEIVANAARDLLESLSYVYPIEYKLTIENLDEPFIDFLPIRVWGQPVDFDRFQMQYHIPNVDEIDFACEFVKTFLYSELTLLNEKMLKLSNHERSRSLTFVYNIALGYFHMIPRIESEQLADLVLSVVPYNSKYQFQTSTYMRESKFNENLRMRLVNDIGKLLDLLVENHSDDVSSMKKALKANMNFD